MMSTSEDLVNGETPTQLESMELETKSVKDTELTYSEKLISLARCPSLRAKFLDAGVRRKGAMVIS